MEPAFSPLLKAERPFSVWVLFFLVLFLLIGFIPALEKTFSRILALFRKVGGPEEPMGGATAGRENAPERRRESPHLDDYEAIVLRRVAQAGRKGVPLRSIAGELAIDPSVVAEALESLHARGLVRATITLVGRTRVHLSGRGRDYAMERGLIPILRHGRWRW